MTTLGGQILTLAAEAAPHGASHSAAVGEGSALALAIPALPALSAVLCTVCAAMGVRSKAPGWITVLCLGLSFVATVMVWMGSGGPGPVDGASIAHGFEWIRVAWGSGPGQSLVSDFALYLDSLTLLWMLFVTGLGTLIALYSTEYMSGDTGPGYCRYFVYFSLFVLAMSCLVMADSLPLLFLGWEGVGLCSYLLIGYYYKKPVAAEAAKKAFIVNRIGDLGLVLGLFTTFTTYGTLELAPLFEMVRAGVDGAGAPTAGTWQSVWIPLFFMVGAFGKSAQLFFYVWLPDAMEGPTPVSALIHAATMVTAGVYLIARLYPVFIADESRTALTIVAWSGTITAFWAATIGMAHFDIKRIMGYSTVSQLGYMFAGLGVLTSTGAAFHVVTHAFFKATLFLCCGAVMHGFAGQLDLRKLSGVGRMKGWGITTIAMLIGCLNLSGFPFTAGFFSKDMILAQSFVTPGSLIAGSSLIGWILLLTAGMTAYYTFRVFFRVFVGPREFEPGEDAHGHEDHGQDDHGHGHGHDDDGHGHGGHGGGGHFHPHAPGWAMNLVMGTLALLSIAAAGLYFIDKEHHGWVGGMVHASTADYTPPISHGEGGHGDAGHGEVGHSADAAHGADDHGAGTHGGEVHEAGTIFWSDPHKVMYYVSGVVGAIGILIAFLLHYVGRTSATHAAADRVTPMLGPIARWARGKWHVDELYDAVIVKPLWVLANVLHVIDKVLVDGLVNLCGALPRMLGRGLRPGQNGLLQSYAAAMAGGVALILLAVWLLS